MREPDPAGPDELGPTRTHLGPTERDSERMSQPGPTLPKGPSAPSSEGDSGPPLPPRLGRYRLGPRLGEGGFGVVYQGFDEELHREVAIKVPNLGRVTSPLDVEAYLAEARALAGLDHPGIVPIYDVGRTEDGLCYLVSKYVPGGDLFRRLKQGQPSYFEAASLVAAVAEALHHAHQRGLIHRDVKPGNILLGPDGRPVVVDFGLALREEDFGTGPTCLGTPGYMSPEQMSQEGHLVDARTDVYSLGVVLYELLTGQRPFRAESVAKLLQQMKSQEPRPPRQLNDRVPRELDRICLKALARRVSDRYSTASDLAEDLGLWLATCGPGPPASEAAPVSGVAAPPSAADSEAVQALVVPKGLRSFDAADADFFLALIPGPRGRDGLPEGLRFWKDRLEDTDSDQAFRVGLLYGPSGCGKSSLVKAGLLPRLAKHVWPVYLEATADTEARLLRALRPRCPGLPDGLPLAEALTAVRRGGGLPAGHKVVLVLDQFEQWLQAPRDWARAELVQALRQCDGRRLQCLVLVRDDFWMSITRFMRELEVPLLEGGNSAAVDLFDPRHARKVLAGFGRAFGALPVGKAMPEEERFLDQAVAQLGPEGVVVPVRLSLFAEMVKGKPWVPATLAEVGGAEGIGLAFLEATFAAPTAPPEHRLHQRAARAVLHTLLPEQGGDIKGRMRPYAALLAASGYAHCPREFDDLLHILDAELRLVTPTDPDPDPEAGPAASPSERYYQLTHDYLVHALRQWLTAKQRQTRRGRAELRLGEQAVLWAARPEPRYLPSAWEWAQARLLVPRASWTDPQRRMMAAAARRHLRRGLRAAATLLLLALAGLWFGRGLEERHRATHAEELRVRLLVADIGQVPAVVAELEGYRDLTDPELARVAANPSRPPGERLRASLALLPRDESQIPYLLGRLLAGGPDELLVIRRQLAPWKERLTGQLWRCAGEGGEGGKQLRAASALAEYDPEGERWPAVAGPVVAQLVQEPTLRVPRWVAALRPARRHLLRPLAAVFRGSDPAERALATGVLIDYASDNPTLLAELIKDADARQYAQFLGGIEPFRAEILASLREELANPPGPAAGEREKGLRTKQQGNAALTLYRMGERDALWPLLRHSPDPRLRSFLIHALAPLGADPAPLIERWGREPDVAARRALLLCLGEFPVGRLPPDTRERLTPELRRSFREDPGPGMHGAAEWLLRRWGPRASLKEIEREMRGQKAPAGRPWRVNSEGHTMVTVGKRGSSPSSSPSGAERPFALATREVSIEQFLHFRPNYFHLAPPGQEGDYPVNVVSWFDAVAYCRWLSEQEGVPEEQMCYPPLADIKSGMKLPVDYARRTGYRLPTEWEWELACRAGTVTSRYYGEADELLPEYASFRDNSDNRLQPLGLRKPNDWGLFDMLGNTMEWCHGVADAPPETDDRDAPTIRGDLPRVARGGGIHHRAEGIRCTQRDTFPATTRWHSIGFRVARTEPQRPAGPQGEKAPKSGPRGERK